MRSGAVITLQAVVNEREMFQTSFLHLLGMDAKKISTLQTTSIF